MIGKKPKKLIALLLALICVLSVSFSVFAAGCYPGEFMEATGKVLPSALNMRASCTTTATIVHVLYQNEGVYCYNNPNALDGWEHVHHDSYAGFVVSSYLQFGPIW